MVRFPCFATNIHCPKPKKEVLRSPEKMSKAYKDCSQDLKPKVSHVPSLSSPDQMQDKSNPKFNMETSQRASLRKSQSLGSALDREGHVSSGTDSEDNVDQGFSSNHFFENNKTRNFGSPENRDVIQPYHESFEFHVNADAVKTETLSSPDDARQLEEAHEGSSNQLSDEHANESGQSAPGTPPMIAKSYSVPDMGLLSRTSKEGSLSNIHGLPRCRSSQSQDVLDEEREESENHEVHIHVMENRERDCSLFESLTDKCDPSADGYESYVYVNSEKDWTGYGTDDMEMKEHVKESPGQSWNELPSKDFKTKRIEEWVSMIDLEESSKLDEPSEVGISIDKVKKGSHVHGSASTAKLDPKSNHGMEAAKNYITSLTPTSTSAQLTNLGLVVIPFLSAFVSLKVLNLSGNGIVRITAGALPRGLHALNLAKNSISTIEGLRELTRLRTLDLSYNRIVRIGHGLASCSSLKELYLTGNKISEVEGLHRLLKLNILDLRFNKISTAKCLGQLAANYSSLQAINLEGNPAQRNVGDEQLKKYLQGLLPHLVYFNKHTIKTNSSKEVSDRPSRDRGQRSEHKLKRKGSLSSATAKASSSSSQAHRSQVVSSTKRSKDRQVRLPPSGTKESHHHRHHFLELSNKLLGLKPDLSMRRSRSEGNLGAS